MRPIATRLLELFDSVAAVSQALEPTDVLKEAWIGSGWTWNGPGTGRDGTSFGASVWHRLVDENDTFVGLKGPYSQLRILNMLNSIPQLHLFPWVAFRYTFILLFFCLCQPF